MPRKYGCLLKDEIQDKRKLVREQKVKIVLLKINNKSKRFKRENSSEDLAYKQLAIKKKV